MREKESGMLQKKSITSDLYEIMKLTENSAIIDMEKITPYLNDYIQIQRVPKYGYITQDEYAVTKVYYVIKGVYSVARISEKGKINILAKRHAPQFIGIDSAVTQKKISTATTQALEDCVVLIINQNYFVRCLRENGDFAVEIVRNLTSKLRNSSKRSDRLLFSSSKEQLLYYIYRYCLEHVQKGPVFKIAEKKEDIADEIGISVRTLYRAMNLLKEEDAISIRDGYIFVTQKQYEQISRLFNKNL